MSIDAASERKNYYIGETASQLRHGFGVYFYSNKFFRYEGDWVKGKKHGHGKLMMADGSYYEGEFKNGEIEGHGFRKWQSTGNTYSGEFSKGEMHGHGVMNYADGSQYQGEFHNNQRHGTGILRDRDGNEYEGAWYKNKKHGQGIQIYENGDEYEGEWVEGCRHGHGDLNCTDGTFYEGQWRADMFNGQGTMAHGSGLTYEGLWINGRPEKEACSIVVELPEGQKYIEVLQGRKFCVNVWVLDSENNPLTGEYGREFQISAGYRFSQKSSQSQSLLELIENIETKPISTPYGYDVLPYPLLDSLQDFEEGEEASGKRRQSQAPLTSKVFGEDTIHETHEADSDVLKPDDKDQDEADGSSSISESKYATSETQLELSAGAAEEVETSLSQMQPPPPQRSSPDGLVEFTNLILPAAPSSYRPFSLDGEIGPDGKRRSKGSRTASAASTSSTSITDGKGGKVSKSKTSLEDRGARPGDYVIIIQEATQPLFLGSRLDPAFVIAKVIAPKKTAKKPQAKR
uniref:MORN repeat-containing protein 1-like n=1 Tax=Phallusia mammillata TaxID=59560 RepID=A0A6F9DLW1_9ASCI|nr:MORN repeat-containing protein 1-like [Phallusia mammillata]